MQRQVGRLEAEAVAADVDDARLHALQRVGHLDHRAADAFVGFVAQNDESWIAYPLGQTVGSAVGTAIINGNDLD